MADLQCLSKLTINEPVT